MFNLESAVCAIASSRSDPEGEILKNRYLTVLWYSSIAWEISASFPELQQSYISGYEKVLSRIWNGAEGLLCLVGGHDVNPPLHAISFHCTSFSLTESPRTLGKFALRGVSLEICCSDALPGLQGAPNVATVCQRGLP